MRDRADKRVKGVVTGITAFGAFVRLDDGRTGLIHISQVADVYVSDVHDFLSVGQSVEPTVLSADEKGRLAFSLKTARQNGINAKQTQPALFVPDAKSSDFEEMLSRYKTASEDKMGDLHKMRPFPKRKNR